MIRQPPREATDVYQIAASSSRVPMFPVSWTATPRYARVASSLRRRYAVRGELEPVGRGGWDQSHPCRRTFGELPVARIRRIGDQHLSPGSTSAAHAISSAADAPRRPPPAAPALTPATFG